MEPMDPMDFPESQEPPEPQERTEMIDQYVQSWIRSSAAHSRKERLTFNRQHISRMTFRSTMIYPDPIMMYVAMLPALLVAAMVHNLFQGVTALVWSIEASLLACAVLLNWMVYNRFRHIRRHLRRKNLLHEPMGLWEEDFSSLEGERRRYAHALLGARPLLLTLIKATSLDIDLEQEDKEISYMVKKLIHADDFDEALREKIYLYLVWVTFLVQKHALTIELIMSLAAESREEELESVKRTRFLSTKTLTYRDPKNVYQDFVSDIG